jgi:hypothetical protein
MDEMVDLSTGGDQEAINTFIAGKVSPCSFYGIVYLHIFVLCLFIVISTSGSWNGSNVAKLETTGTNPHQFIFNGLISVLKTQLLKSSQFLIKLNKVSVLTKKARYISTRQSSVYRDFFPTKSDILEFSYQILLFSVTKIDFRNTIQKVCARFNSNGTFSFCH